MPTEMCADNAAPQMRADVASDNVFGFVSDNESAAEELVANNRQFAIASAESNTARSTLPSSNKKHKVDPRQTGLKQSLVRQLNKDETWKKEHLQFLKELHVKIATSKR